MGGLHAHVAGGELGLLGELFQFLGDGGAFGQPEHQAGAGEFRVQGEEAHLLPELAVVAAFGLLEHLEVGLQLGLGLEGGAVDALELGVGLVALVVGAGEGGELEGADVAGAHHVRAGAQVDEIAAAVVGDRFALGDILEVAQLVFAGRGALGQRA